jgi:hypothetical protein
MSGKKGMKHYLLATKLEAVMNVLYSMFEQFLLLFVIKFQEHQYACPKEKKNAPEAT